VTTISYIPTRINLGCGKKVYPGFWNVDKFQVPGVDMVADLDMFPWPFKDNHYDVIRAENSLYCFDFLKAMEEIYRIATPGAQVQITVTPFSYPMACADPHGKKFFCWTSFDYYQGGWYSNAQFKVIKREYIFSSHKSLKWISFFINMCPKFYTRFLSFILPSQELYFEVKVVK